MKLTARSQDCFKVKFLTRKLRKGFTFTDDIQFEIGIIRKWHKISKENNSSEINLIVIVEFRSSQCLPL